MFALTSRTPIAGLLLSLFAISCDGSTKDDVSDTQPSDLNCEDISASAGGDQSVALGALVTLDASGSEVCATDDVSYSWTFDVVPVDSAVDEDSLSDNRSATASIADFTPDLPGDYVLSLEVSDGENTSLPDIVVVTVTADDLPPMADCGGDKTGRVGERVSLDGSASSDPEGAEVSFSWSLSSTPSCSDMSSRDVYDPDQYDASLIPDCDGLYVMALVVSDGAQWSDPDYCTIDVASENRAPIADAGDGGDLSSCAGSDIHLNGFGSYDLDGDEILYAWSLLDKPAASGASDDDFDDTASAEPVFTLPDDPVVEGDYVFELSVYDGNDWSAPDIVTVTILGESENNPPISNAGDDQTITATAECTSSSYVWTCSSCDDERVELDGSASYDEDGDDVEFFWRDLDDALEFVTPHSPITYVDVPGIPAEYGVETTVEYEARLEVTDDCGAMEGDIAVITYSCTGSAP